jgi:hypothetical protein
MSALRLALVTDVAIDAADVVLVSEWLETLVAEVRRTVMKSTWVKQA